MVSHHGMVRGAVFFDTGAEQGGRREKRAIASGFEVGGFEVL